MADDAGGGPQILEALLKTDSASSWNQDKLADFGKKTRREARALVKGGGVAGGSGSGGGGDGDEIDQMDTDEAFAPATSADVKAQTIVDLEAMAFTEGGHLMTNKRCDLHSKSWR